MSRERSRVRVPSTPPRMNSARVGYNYPMTQISNRELITLLRNVAAVLEVTGENRFRTVAYVHAADSIELLNQPISDFIVDEKIKGIPGIGDTISDYLVQISTTGNCKHFEAILKKAPKGMFELMTIPGVGAKKAYRLCTELKVSDIPDLKSAIVRGEVQELEGFGDKSASEILKSINSLKSRSKRVILLEAINYSSHIRKDLEKNPDIVRIEFVGSLRRQAPTIGDLDSAILVKKDREREVMEFIQKQDWVENIIVSGEKKISLMTKWGLQLDVRVQNKETYGAQLQYFTGSKQHNVELRTLALEKNLSINEYGIKNLKTGKVINCATEQELYAELGLEFIPPEMREARGEIELAKSHAIPDLVTLSDIKGDIHTHSPFKTSSPLDEGQSTVAESLNTAKALGYEYFGFSDHAPRLTTTSEKSVLKELETRTKFLIKESKKIPEIHLFIGLEVDIMADTTLCLPDSILDTLDYGIASIHSGHRQERAQITERLLRAVEHPKIRLLGHPTGRLLNQREAYEADWDAVFKACHKHNVALEINAGPPRLDLPDDLIFQAKRFGCKFMINSDAHDSESLANLHMGVSMARRGWLTKSDVINTKNLADFSKFISGGSH